MTVFKKKVLQRYEKGTFIKALNEELNVAQSMIYNWRTKIQHDANVGPNLYP